MSVLLRPKFLPTSLPLVTLGAGVAVANATELITGVKLGLKWVNDLVVAGGKVGGILAEFQQEPPSAMSHIPKMGASLVLGIGLNICQGNAKLPSELTTKMRWLEAISHKPVDRNRLVCQIAFEIEQMLEILSSGNIQAVLDAWRKRSVTLGAAVKSQANSETIAGQAIDITNSGSLIIQTPQGVRQLHAGEVSVRKLDGSYY
jgi:BirA family biotin operon repressor/biotin-[acetyl-CoA-carboxylase] ligase